MVACLYEAEGEGSWDGTGLPCRPDCSALPDATWDFITGNIRGLTGVVGLYREEYFFFKKSHVSYLLFFLHFS